MKSYIKNFGIYALIAIIILLYILWGAIFVPSIYSNGEWYYGIENILFGKSGNISPFIYSTCFSILLGYIGVFLLYKFTTKRFCLRFLYFYLLLFAVISTIIMSLAVESGWSGMICYRALMFYPTKYYLVSNVFLLSTIIILSKKNEHLFASKYTEKQEAILSSIVFCFLVIATFPYFMNLSNITIMEQSTPRRGDCYSSDVEKVKSCLVRRIILENVPFGEHLVTVYPEAVKGFNNIKSLEAGRDYYDGIYITERGRPRSSFPVIDIKNNKEKITFLPSLRRYSGTIVLYYEDVILYKDANGNHAFLVISVEKTMLDGNRSFMICNIGDYSLSKDLKRELNKVYSFESVVDMQYMYGERLSISLDKREEPTEIYFKVNGLNFKFNK